MARKDITAWLQREWTSGASKDGARLIDTPGEGARRAQYTRVSTTPLHFRVYIRTLSQRAHVEASTRLSERLKKGERS